ncbi:MAG: SRPBCC family protein [Actinomycetes bacterium]
MRVSVEVAAPAEVVWDLVTDIHDGQTVLPGVVFERRREPDAGGRFGPGLVWAEHRTRAGRTHTDVVRVTDVDEGRAYTVVGDGPGGDAASTTLWVDPRGPARARLGLDLRYRPATRAGRVAAWLARPVADPPLRRMVRAELDVLAGEAARRHAAGAGAG